MMLHRPRFGASDVQHGAGPGLQRATHGCQHQSTVLGQAQIHGDGAPATLGQPCGDPSQVALLHMTYHAVDTKWALPPGGPA